VKDYTTRVELAAIPIVAVVLGILFVLAAAADQGVWAWLLAGVVAILLAALLVWRFSRRHPHAAADQPAPAARHATDADTTYRVLVIADESCIDPGFPAQLRSHASGRTVEALVIAPAIGSWLQRWTGDEGAHRDARRHLDDTVAALAAAGIGARGEEGTDDPLQAADDGLREFGAHEILFVTKPGTGTDWAEKGVVETARERYAVPVVHIALSES